MKSTIPAHESIEEAACVQVARGTFSIEQAEQLVRDYRKTFGDLPRSEARRQRGQK